MPDAASETVDLALAYQAATTTISGRLSRILALLWRQVDPWSVRAAWDLRLPEAVGAFAAAQAAAAAMADAYVTRSLRAQGVGGDAFAPAGVGGVTEGSPLLVAPEAFAGVAASGLSLEALLSIPAARSRQALLTGLPRAPVMAAAQASLTMYAHTEIADASTLAASAAMTTRNVTRYVRVTGPRCCARCALLSGRTYHVSEFDRHPNCFPAGVLVSGPNVEGATRRWFEGELVTLTTASGEKLPLTGNHPVLTRRGWVPANLLREGDDVIRSTRPQGAAALVVPDHDQVPAPIEDVWGSLGVLGIDRVPASAEDFHGDGGQGEVHVAGADRTLRGEVLRAILQEASERPLALGFGLSAGLVRQGSAEQRHVGAGRQGASTLVASGSSFGVAHEGVAGHAGLSHTAALDALQGEGLGDAVATHSVLLAERELAGAREVGPGQILVGEDCTSSRWDAPAGPLTPENSAGYVRNGQDLHHRLSGQVEFDRLVQVVRVRWAGHVYSLSTSEGWHSANGIIVSNCHCTMRPVTDIETADVPSPQQLYRDGRITDLTLAERGALDLGADISQVVNARAGMYSVGGRKYTTTGTTRQGIAGARILARDIARAGGAAPGAVYANFTIGRSQVAQATAKYGPMMRRGTPFQRHHADGMTSTSAYRYTRTARLSVSEILRTSTSQEDAVRMLINHGYVFAEQGAAAALERLARAS